MEVGASVPGAGRTEKAEARVLLRATKVEYGTSPMVPWLGICLPMQETQVPPPVQEDSTCCRAIKPVHQNYLSQLATARATREAAAMRSPHTTTREWPLLTASRGSLRVAAKTQHSQK